MGIMSSNLAQRILSAIVAAPIIIALALWKNFWGWQLLIVVAVFLALIEFSNMAFTENEKLERLVTIITGMLFSVFMITSYNYTPVIYPWIVAFTLLIMVFTGTPIEKSAVSTAKIFVGIFYIAQLMNYSALIKLYPNGGKWILYTLLVIWAGDTGAYFVGKTIGKHKLAPVISPKKTWEGAAGGLVASLLIGLLATKFISGFSVYHALILSAITGIAGQIGDLAESMFKRSFGVKDSGNLIPGHGGILDRIDALLFAFPIVFGYLWFSLPQYNIFLI